MNTTRRAVLASIGAGTVAGLAGCLGSGENVDGYTAFFPLHDWTEEIAGDELTFENPVGTGRMGHGWSPDGDITTDVASSDMFIYLDTPEFSWAQGLAETLEDDYEDVLVVDALEGLEPYVIPFDTEDEEREEEMPTPDYDHEFDTEALGLDDFETWDLRDENRIGWWHDDHWHGGPFDVPLDSFVPVGIVLTDTDGRVVPLGEGEPYHVDARVAEDADDDVVSIESRGDHIEFHGRALGETEVIFEIYENDERLNDTSEKPVRVEVLEDADPGEGFFDPHLWVDPIHAQRMVDNITDALAEYDSDNEERYRENADAYKERLDDVDQQFRNVIEDAEVRTAVFAGHDSFQYLERRYNFELVTPVGVTPDAAETFDDIANLVEVIDEHNIDTVLYDPFEAPDPGENYPQMVDLILEDSDVERAEPLTPAEGITEEWDEQGWGWVEQMENVNIPSLESALNPDR